MKFLVTTKPNGNTQPPPDQVESLLNQTLANLQNEVASGYADGYYFIAEGETLGIVNAATIEDAWKAAMTNPWLPYIQTEIRPLADAKTMIEAYLDVFRASQREPVPA